MRRLKAKTKEEKCKYKRCSYKQIPGTRYCEKHEFGIGAQPELLVFPREVSIRDRLNMQRIVDFIYQKQN